MYPSQGPKTIPTSERSISDGEITSISYGTKTTMTILGPIFPTIFNLPTINRIFLTKCHTLHSKLHQLKRN